MMRIEDAQVGMKRLVSARLSRLSLQRSDLPLHLFNNVADAEKIRFRRFQFSKRFAFKRFVFGNASRFFKNSTPIFRPRAQDQIDLALFHHRVGAATDAGVREQTVNVLQTADRLVEQIF